MVRRYVAVAALNASVDTVKGGIKGPEHRRHDIGPREKGVHTNGTEPLADRTLIRVTIGENSDEAQAYHMSINTHFAITISRCGRIRPVAGWVEGMNTPLPRVTGAAGILY